MFILAATNIEGRAHDALADQTIHLRSYIEEDADIALSQGAIEKSREAYNELAFFVAQQFFFGRITCLSLFFYKSSTKLPEAEQQSLSVYTDRTTRANYL